MTITEQIYELVKTLPSDRASEILLFAEFVRDKHLRTSQSQEQGHDSDWVELVQSLAGAWADDFPSLEEIRADD
jgi:hypothetical protein